MTELTAHALPKWLLERLRCPLCGSDLSPRADEVVCIDGHRWPDREGLFDFTTDQLSDEAVATLENFGYEWAAFPVIQDEDAQFWERYSRDLPSEAIDGRIAVDIGCGKGRFTWFIAQRARHVVAFDGSAALVAARNLSSLSNTTVFRADLHHAPLADGSFELVTCIGVLHYVPDPARGFAEVVRLLAPGGTLLLSVYSRPEERGVRRLALKAAASVRRVTPRLPKPLLKAMSAPIGAVLYGLVVVPGRVGVLIHSRRLAGLPLQTYRGRPLRSLWLDTFNRLHAPFEHRFDRAEVEGWLAAAELEQLSIREDAGWMVVARRPAQPSDS